MNGEEGQEVSVEGHPGPGWSSPIGEEGTLRPGGETTGASTLTWGQALLGGSAGDQQYIHNVLQHITAAAAERHRKRKRHHRHKRKKNKRAKEKKEETRKKRDTSPEEQVGRGKRKRSRGGASRPSSDDDDATSKRRRRREKESSASTVSPLLKMVMSDLSRGYFTPGGQAKPERGLPQGLGLGEGLGLGAASCSHSTSTPQSCHSGGSLSSMGGSTMHTRVPSSRSMPPSASPSQTQAISHHPLLEPPRFPLPPLVEERRLPPPLPTIRATRGPFLSLHGSSLPHPPSFGVILPSVAPSSSRMHQLQPRQSFPSLAGLRTPTRFSPLHFRSSREWHGVDPPSDGEVGSPNPEVYRANPRLYSLPSQEAMTQETEIQSGFWRVS